MKKGNKTINYNSMNRNDQIQADHTVPISDEIFRVLFDESNNAIVYVNTLGTIIHINNAVEEMIGFTRDELIGRHFSKLKIFRVKDLPVLLKKFATTVMAGRVIDGNHRNVNVMELELTRKNKETIHI